MGPEATVGRDVAVHDAVDGRPVVTVPVTAHRPHRLTVDDVMTRDVVTIARDATFHEMIGLMDRRGISALPVVGDGGEVIGIVSDADLLPKENPPRPRRRWFPEGNGAAEMRRRAAGVNAGDVMTTPVISVPSGALVAVAVRLLQDRAIKRLVVLDADHRLVGIVSRRDLLAGFSRTDAEIRADVVDGVIPRWLLVDPVHVRVEVEGGVVRLAGRVERRSDAEVLPHLVRGLDGVVEVESTLEYSLDDRHLAPARELRVS